MSLLYKYQNGGKYTYGDRDYKKDSGGNWSVSVNGVWTPLSQNVEARTKELNKNAKFVGELQGYNQDQSSRYDMMGNNKPQVASSTNINNTPQQVLPRKADPLKDLTEQQQQADFLIQQGKAARYLGDAYYNQKGDQKELKELMLREIQKNPNIMKDIDANEYKLFLERDKAARDKQGIGYTVANNISSFMADPITTGGNWLKGEGAMMDQGTVLHDPSNPNYNNYVKATGADSYISQGVNIFNPGSWAADSKVANQKGDYLGAALSLTDAIGAGKIADATSLVGRSSKGLINLEQKAGQAYNKVASGNSLLPYAWKMEKVNDTGALLKNKYNLSDEEAFVLGKYINTPYAIKRGTEESQIFDNLIKRNSAVLDEVNTPVTKVLNHSTNSGKDIVPSTFGSTFTFPGNRSWSAGVDPRFADTGRTRLVIPSKYNKKLDFTAVPYDDPRLAMGWNSRPSSKTLTDLMSMSSEKELIGNIPEGYKVIGKNNEDGFENIFIKPVKGRGGFNKGGERSFGAYGHDIETNPNIVYKESESGNIIPFNKETGKSLQEEYTNELKQYYESPEFNRIMKEEHPDVDIEKYKKVTLENLDKELVYNPSTVPENSSGVYTAKNSSSTAYMPGYVPTFKQRVANANNNDYQYQSDHGLSRVSDPSATWHELSHQRTNSDELLPDQLTRSHLEENASPFAEDMDYHGKATEFEVRLRQLKKDLKNQGINDYFVNPTTADHIKQLDAVKLKEKGETLFTEMKGKYRALKNSGANEADLEKVKNQFYDDMDKLESQVGIKKTSRDTHDLLKRWTPEFLAEKARTLPVLVPAAGLAGAASLTNPWQQEQPKFKDGGLLLSKKDNKFNTKAGLLLKYQNGDKLTANLFDPKKRLLKRYPGMQGVYGENGENLNIIKDKNYNAAQHGFGDIEFIYPGEKEIVYSPEYTYVNPTPEKYTIPYNPKGAGIGDVYLDMQHGMRDDPEYMKLLKNFTQTAIAGRGAAMEKWYKYDMENQPDMKSQFDSPEGKERYMENFVDSYLRSELAAEGKGKRTKDSKGYSVDREYNTPEMKSSAKVILDYIKTKH